jgi:hypothetical protein
LRLNEIQVIGSHNSYKEAIKPPLMQQLMVRYSTLFATLDYQHVPLTHQLDLGLRKLEIDVVFDPKGGRFANPLGVQQESVLAFSQNHALADFPGKGSPDLPAYYPNP